ncbi:MAG TPA: hypothetical protein VMT63_12175 [Bacteroidales bacterium]|nr:hypothetical protein [Bacteroidales bacterium]
MSKNEIAELYRSRYVYYSEMEANAREKVTLISFLRMGVFLLGLFLSIYAFSKAAWMGAIALAASVTAFLFLLKHFNRLSADAGFYSRMAGINKAEKEALYGNFTPFDGAEGESDAAHDFSADTDIFGNDSLFGMLNRTSTIYGRNRLAQWLKYPLAAEGSLSERQEAVKELSGMLEWRQEFIATGQVNSLEAQDIDDFRQWLEEEGNATGRKLKNTALVILPFLSILSLCLVLAGLAAWQLFATSFLFNLLLVGAGLKKTNRIHRRVTGKNEFLSSAGKLLILTGREDFSSGVFRQMKHDLFSGDIQAGRMMKRLSAITDLFDSRLNMFAGFLLNGLLLWDYQCLRALEKWKSEASGHFPVWLQFIGTTEAYISLANFAFNNGEFAYPEAVNGRLVLKAVSMGHPMIGEETRVCNDIEIAENEIIVITGANMSGKSTFLRTLAINMVLACTGAPVCARTMQFRKMRLFTSMRTSDSLSHGESYFYAELKRLRRLKDLLDGKEDVFFLLDEILKGTNSADKSTGSKLFIARIAGMGATGIIATHDVSLGEMGTNNGGIITNKCFEIEICGEKISFDYKLRNGVTSRMNAALLMKEMGIVD